MKKTAHLDDIEAVRIVSDMRRRTLEAVLEEILIDFDCLSPGLRKRVAIMTDDEFMISVAEGVIAYERGDRGKPWSEVKEELGL